MLYSVLCLSQQVLYVDNLSFSQYLITDSATVNILVINLGLGYLLEGKFLQVELLDKRVSVHF